MKFTLATYSLKNRNVYTLYNLWKDLIASEKRPMILNPPDRPSLNYITRRILDEKAKWGGYGIPVVENIEKDNCIILTWVGIYTKHAFTIKIYDNYTTIKWYKCKYRLSNIFNLEESLINRCNEFYHTIITKIKIYYLYMKERILYW